MRVAVVAGVVIPHDAVSNAAVEQVAALHELPEVESVALFTHACDRDVAVEAHTVDNSWQLVNHPAFAEADIAIFHWAIWYDLFNVITLLGGGSNGPVPVVHFHNCTPASLVPEDQRSTIQQSMAQIAHVIGLGARLWTYSEFNRRTLLEWGADERDIEFVPFAIELPRPRARGPVDDDRVRVLCVGRLVPAKGVHVLIEALALLDPTVRGRIALRVVSSATFSDDEYRSEVEGRIAALGLAPVVEIVDDPTDDVLAELYAESEVVVSPSFHEGLCVPVIEGYAHGCRVIGTTAGNLPFIVVAPDPVVPPDDPAALAAALGDVVGAPIVDDERYVAERDRIVSSFSPSSAREHLLTACRSALGRRAGSVERAPSTPPTATVTTSTRSTA